MQSAIAYQQVALANIEVYLDIHFYLPVSVNSTNIPGSNLRFLSSIINIIMSCSLFCRILSLLLSCLVMPRGCQSLAVERSTMVRYLVITHSPHFYLKKGQERVWKKHTERSMNLCFFAPNFIVTMILMHLLCVDVPCQIL